MAKIVDLINLALLSKYVINIVQIRHTLFLPHILCSNKMSPKKFLKRDSPQGFELQGTFS